MSDEKKFEIEAYGQKFEVTEEQYRQHQLQADPLSHLQHMDGRTKLLIVDDKGGVTNYAMKPMVDTSELTDPKAAAQGMRRQQKLTEVLEQTVLARKDPGSGINAEYVTFEEWHKLNTEFHKYLTDNPKASANEAAREVGFMPLNRYVDKLLQKRPDGSIRKIRDVLVGELGVRPTGAIMLLKSNPGESSQTGGNLVVGPHSKHNTGR